MGYAPRVPAHMAPQLKALLKAQAGGGAVTGRGLEEQPWAWPGGAAVGVAWRSSRGRGLEEERPLGHGLGHQSSPCPPFSLCFWSLCSEPPPPPGPPPKPPCLVQPIVD